jgi:hypothetical protein
MATACSTTTVFAAPLEMGEAEAPPVYRLRKTFAAVHFEPSGKGRIVFLPEGAVLKVVGSSRLAQCCEVLSENQLYNMFEADLLGPWSMRVKRRPARGILARAAASCA